MFVATHFLIIIKDLKYPQHYTKRFCLFSRQGSDSLVPLRSLAAIALARGTLYATSHPKNVCKRVKPWGLCMTFLSLQTSPTSTWTNFINLSNSRLLLELINLYDFFTYSTPTFLKLTCHLSINGFTII